MSRRSSLVGEASGDTIRFGKSLALADVGVSD